MTSPMSLVLLAVILAVAAIASVTVAALLVLDKRAAERHGRRVPERTLHLLELAGGWPGSLLARRLVRHKTAKTSYRVAATAAAILHLAIAAGLLAASAR